MMKRYFYIMGLALLTLQFPLIVSGIELLYFPTYDAKEDTVVLSNPYLTGVLLTLYWSEVESTRGEYHWEAVEKRISEWTGAGKKVALRIMWSSSGRWPHPSAKKPTPQWVYDEGAKYVMADISKTQVPVIWDPIWQRYAREFLVELARKFDGNPGILFIDVTPGAESNPYRGRLGQAEPEFARKFLDVAASNGQVYSDTLWLDVVQKQTETSKSIFVKTPILVTLNMGGIEADQFHGIGEWCVAHGVMVGQNGLTGDSYRKDSARKRAFLEWGKQVPLYFEMNHSTQAPEMGTLQAVVEAAKRIGATYLAIYSSDILQAIPGLSGYDKRKEEALEYGTRLKSPAKTKKNE